LVITRLAEGSSELKISAVPLLHSAPSARSPTNPAAAEALSAKAETVDPEPWQKEPLPHDVCKMENPLQTLPPPMVPASLLAIEPPPPGSSPASPRGVRVPPVPADSFVEPPVPPWLGLLEVLPRTWIS
jgi:hypothetical protein